VITFDGVAVTYPGAVSPVLRGIDLHVPEGELCLVVGETGCGKSTLLRCINGLVPHFTGGRLDGRVLVDGRDTATHPPRELAEVVGYVGQVPQSGFVTDVVEDELAYAMESVGLPSDVMRRRVEEVLDLLGLGDVRDRPLLSLSAGQQQRVAIGSVLTVQPRILVLDEPTSALDPPAAEEVLAALTRLVHDLGLTVVVAEHRLERVVQYADSVVALPGDGSVARHGPPADVLAAAAVRPPVIELGQLAQWHPLPLSVRDARRRAGELRARLAPLTTTRTSSPVGEAVVAARGVTAAYGDVWALRGVDLTLRAGEVTTLMGRNGAGKSTLLAVLAGLRSPSSGRVSLPGDDGSATRAVALVPQEAGDLLWAATVGRECVESDADARVEPGTTRALLRSLAPAVDDDAHPRDLSEGQRLMLCLAVMLAGGSRVVALDEPTRGLDYGAKRRLVEVLRGLADGGASVVLATHDVELVAEVADRVVILADGEVVADGATTDIVLSSPAFAPQVAKVLAPLPILTVDDARAALA
jgi:energy-coupling factor transporter ATP-binding protein EcfA2